MMIQVSHGADPDDWFVVKPLPGKTERSVAGTPITNEDAVESLISAGRTVYQLDGVVAMTGGGFAVRMPR